MPAAIIRNLVPAVLFIAVAWVLPTARVTRVNRGNTIRLVAGAVLFALSALSFVFALDRASPGVVVVLINTSPMWAVVFAALILRERLTRFAIAGALLSVAGILVVLWLR